MPTMFRKPLEPSFESNIKDRKFTLTIPYSDSFRYYEDVLDGVAIKDSLDEKKARISVTIPEDKAMAKQIARNFQQQLCKLNDYNFITHVHLSVVTTALSQLGTFTLRLFGENLLDNGSHQHHADYSSAFNGGNMAF